MHFRHNMKVIITGGAGFIGHHLVKKLLNLGWSVTVLDNMSTGSLDNLPTHERLVVIELDIIHDKLPELDFDYLVHLASPVSVPESIEMPMKYWQGIGIASRRILEWAYVKGAKAVVASSTAAVYGSIDRIPLKETDQTSPMSPYAEFKLEMEHMLTSYHRPEFRCTALRFFNVFGEGQRNVGGYVSAVPIFLKQYKDHLPITVTGDGKQTRDWIYVGDVVNAIYMSLYQDWSSQMPIYNVGSGIETSVLDLAKTFQGKIIYIEARDEPNRSVSDISRIKKELGWTPEMSLLNWIKKVK